MDKNGHIDKMVDDTMNSIDNIRRASPKANLLTRINAHMLNRGKATIWEFLTSFITRPAVTMAAVLLIIMLNLVVIFADRGNNYVQQQTLVDGQGFSIANPSAMYDFENPEP